MSQACSFLSLGVDNLVVSWWRQCRSAHACGLRGPAGVWDPPSGLATFRPQWPRSPRSAVVFNGAVRKRPRSAGAQLGGWAEGGDPTRAAIAMGRRANAGKVGAPESTGCMTAPGGCNDRGALSLHRGQTATPGTPHQSVGHNGLRGPLTTCGQIHPRQRSHAAAGKRRHGGHPRPPASPCEGCGALRRRGPGGRPSIRRSERWVGQDRAVRCSKGRLGWPSFEMHPPQSVRCRTRALGPVRLTAVTRVPPEESRRVSR